MVDIVSSVFCRGAWFVSQPLELLLPESLPTLVAPTQRACGRISLVPLLMLTPLVENILGGCRLREFAQTALLRVPPPLPG